MKPVIVSKIIDRDVKAVWSAITEIDQMVLWFFNNIPAFKAEVGFKTWFVVANEGRTFYHLWEIIKVIENEMIEVEWTYPDYVKEPFLVTFNLRSLGNNQTQFTTIAKGIEIFEEFNIPEFTRESCIGGWEYFSTQLKNYLEK